MKRWYVVHTQANGEMRAVQNLRRQGYEVYCPQVSKRRRHARRVEVVARALFPRYLFVALDLEHQQWRSINGTFGVSYLLTDESGPQAVPDGLVDEIRSLENEDGIIEPAAGQEFSPGQALEILEGPMAECTGSFLQMSARERVVMLLSVLNRSVRVTVPRRAVTAG